MEESETDNTYHRKDMNQAHNEFVKMTEVGALVQEAMQHCLDQIAKKDKTAQTTKHDLRQLETKFKQQQEQVTQLSKLKNDVTGLLKSQKYHSIEIESIHQSLRDREDKLKDQFMMHMLRVQELDVKMGHINARFDKCNDNINDNRMHTLKVQENLQTKMNEGFANLELATMGSKNDEILVKNEILISNYDKLMGAVREVASQEIETVVRKLNVDNDRFLDLELKIRTFGQMQTKLKRLDDNLTALQSKVGETQECSMFVERQLPLLIHLQVQDGLQRLITTEKQRKMIEQRDVILLGELNTYIKTAQGQPTRFAQLIRRLSEFGQSCSENGGSIGFSFNRDYSPLWSNKQLGLKVDKTQEVKFMKDSLLEQVIEVKEKLENKIVNVVVGNSSSSSSSLAELRTENADQMTPLKSVLKNEVVIDSLPETVQSPLIKQKSFKTIKSMKLNKSGLNLTKMMGAAVSKVVVLNRIDTKRLQMVEHKQRVFMRGAKALYAEVLDDFQLQMKVLEDQLQTSFTSQGQQADYIQTMRTHMTDASPDRHKLISKLKKQDKIIKEFQDKEEERKIEQQMVLSNLQRRSSTRTIKKDVPTADDIHKLIKQTVSQNMIALELLTQQVEATQQQLSLNTQQLNEHFEQKTILVEQSLKQQLSDALTKVLECGNQMNLEIQHISRQVESTSEATVNTAKRAMEISEDLQVQFLTDYQEFVRERKRWKSDFKIATQSAKTNFNQIEGLLQDCQSNNELNTSVLKEVVDALMIAQLCERQDLEDKKNLGLLGTSALKVDKNCLSCSGNQSQTLHQFKMACLCYTSSMVPYQEKLYKVSDLLAVKSNILAHSCRQIRNKIHGAFYDGPDLQKHHDERGFVIEPLLNETFSPKSPTKSKPISLGVTINPTLRESEPFDPTFTSQLTKDPIHIESTHYSSMAEQRAQSRLQQSQYHSELSMVCTDRIPTASEIIIVGTKPGTAATKFMQSRNASQLRSSFKDSFRQSTSQLGRRKSKN